MRTAIEHGTHRRNACMKTVRQTRAVSFIATPRLFFWLQSKQQSRVFIFNLVSMCASVSRPHVTPLHVDLDPCFSCFPKQSATIQERHLSKISRTFQNESAFDRSIILLFFFRFLHNQPELATEATCPPQPRRQQTVQVPPPFHS